MAVGAAAADDQSDGSFALPRDVVQAATAFQSYMASAAKIDAGFTNGNGVEKHLRTGSAYEAAQLEEGMIAYGAVVAMQDDRFVAGVQAAAGRGDARSAFADRLVQDPYAATRIDGAGEAGQRVAAAWAADASPLVAAGVQVKAAAYSVQHQSWSKVMVVNAAGRLATVKSLSAQRLEPSEGDSQAMMQSVSTAAPLAGAAGDSTASFTPVQARALALAAESIVGRAQGADRDRLTPLLTEHESAFCLKMAKLNLYQCMAVAGPQYEDIFCLGQHAMYDTASCVAQASQGVGAASTVAMLSPRPAAAAAPQAAYTTLVAHHSLRIAPNN
ncbi:MAG TPA: hypothetical protein VFE13_03685 [Caulobacteraceae bacterium]|jgi:hypothetical protein|nr:hypothetical protein [Caulobacteraceae bacterium]